VYHGALGGQGAAAFCRIDRDTGGGARNVQRGCGSRHNEIYSHVVNSNPAVWNGLNREVGERQGDTRAYRGELKDMEGKEKNKEEGHVAQNTFSKLTLC